MCNIDFYARNNTHERSLQIVVVHGAVYEAADCFSEKAEPLPTAYYCFCLFLRIFNRCHYFGLDIISHNMNKGNISFKSIERLISK